MEVFRAPRLITAGERIARRQRRRPRRQTDQPTAWSLRWKAVSSIDRGRGDNDRYGERARDPVITLVHVKKTDEISGEGNPTDRSIRLISQSVWAKSAGWQACEKEWQPFSL